jgi:hypothetical protein
MAAPSRISPAELEDLGNYHERITEPQARFIEHMWAINGRGRTKLLRFGLVADVPKAEIKRAWGISRQAIEKQQSLLKAERGGHRDEKSLSRRVDYEWALTATEAFTQLLRFYIVTLLPTAVIRRGLGLRDSILIVGLGVSKQAISKQRKLWREYRRKHGLPDRPMSMFGR